MRGMFTLLVFLGWLAGPASAPTEAKIFSTFVRDAKRGNTLYQKGQFADAAKEFTAALSHSPQSDQLHFNLGTALYKSGDYAGAIEHLRQALLGEHGDLAESIHYNLGNALYKKGKASESKDQKKVAQDWQEALDQYAQSLRLNPDDPDASFNYDFVKKELERLKKEEQQQKSQSQPQPSPSSSSSERQKPQDSSGTSGGPQSPQKSFGQVSASEKPPEHPSAPAEEKKDRGEQKGEQKNSAEETAKEKSPQPTTVEKEKPTAGTETTGEASPVEGGEMSPKEAQMRLDEYLQNEEPKGLLFLNSVPGQESTVLKDW